MEKKIFLGEARELAKFFWLGGGICDGGGGVGSLGSRGNGSESLGKGRVGSKSSTLQ